MVELDLGSLDTLAGVSYSMLPCAGMLSGWHGHERRDQHDDELALCGDPAGRFFRRHIGKSFVPRLPRFLTPSAEA